MRLTQKLLELGGTDADVIDPDPYLASLARRGRLFDTKGIKIVRGAANQCHRNAVSLWLKGKCSKIAVGYYLCFDGVWRQHSWGVARSGAILDTHSGGKQYFGIRLDDLQAMVFAELNYGFREVMRWRDRNPDRFAPIVDAARKLIPS